MTTNVDSQIEADGSKSNRGFVARAPFAELVQRWAAFASLALLGVIAVVFGFFFKHTFDLYSRGNPPLASAYRADVSRLLTYGQVTLIVAMVALAVWSAFAVANAQRVFHSLRSIWTAAGGWFMVPIAAYLAHQLLDPTLKSGWILTGVVSLSFMYIPHGTIGGTAKDLGGSTYLARIWYMLALLAAVLMWAALAGATHGLPGNDPQSAMRVKAFLCFVSGLLLFAGAATYFATAQHIGEMTHHKWVEATSPKGANRVLSGSVAMTRPADFVPKAPIPTHALRVVVWCGFFVLYIASISATFGVRRRAILAEVRDGSLATHDLAASATHMFDRVIVLAFVAHAMYVVWGIAAAVNARRRTLLAPSPWGITAAFLTGTVFLLFTSGRGDTFATTMLVIAIGVVYIGFIVGQLLLGRSAVALGGSGRLFLSWLIAEFGLGSCIAYVSRVARDDMQLLIIGALLAAFAVLSSVLAWLTMSRFDSACTGNESAQVRPAQRLLSRTLTSSHS